MTDPTPSQRDQRHAERRFDIEVRRHLTRNFITHLIHGMFGQTGFRLLNAPTFLPAYMILLSGGSDFVVGLALGLQALGAAISPFLGASLVEHRKKALPVAMWVGTATRLQILIIALAGLLLPPEWALAVILVTLTVYGAFQGMQGVIFQFVMSKVIPVSRRGRLTGLRNFTAGLTAAGVAYLGGFWFLGDTPTIQGYSNIFVLAFVLASLGLAALLFMHEPELPTVVAKTGTGIDWARIPVLLREDKAFRRFVTARSLTTAGRLAMPFYILYAGQQLGLSGVVIGELSLCYLGADTASNLVWGNLGDRTGYRLTFMGATAVWAIQQGCQMIRVHDVREMARFACMADGIKAGLEFRPA